MKNPIPISVLLMALLAGCAAPPDAAPPTANVPVQWQAPLPHGGKITDLTQWWQSLGDPVLVELIAASQTVSPTIAGARSRLVQARSTLASANAANRPTLDASLAAQRGITGSNVTLGTATQANLAASWELDLFGANRQTSDAAGAKLGGAQAQWHEARVSVAAEVANQYFSWHNCHRILEVLKADAASRTESARLTGLTAQAGFTAPANAALARASAAEGNARATNQKAQCDTTLKALVELTALPEAELQQKLQQAPADAAQNAMIGVATLPASVLAQRPDVYSAERDVAAASADVGAAEADRYPRLVLNGSVGALNFTSASGSLDLNTWSIGPITLSVPITDGGRRIANVEAAKARYDEAASLYRAKTRLAVREVESALLSLASTDARKADATAATAGYTTAFDAAQARYLAGSGSLPDLEEARRIALAARTALLQLELERTSAWISLYRALGGGWSANATDTAQASP